jgi:hypothetical protein
LQKQNQKIIDGRGLFDSQGAGKSNPLRRLRWGNRHDPEPRTGAGYCSSCSVSKDGKLGKRKTLMPTLPTGSHGRPVGVVE